MKTRRALSQVGGPTRTTGDAGAAALLADAMDRAAFEESDALTHGFHPWPARMHRAIAGVSIAHFSRPGDRVLLTKGAAVEGTAIIARELGSRLRKLGMSAEKIESCRAYLDRISIIPEARQAARCPGTSAMHDVTEGGIATALEELSTAGGCRLRSRPLGTLSSSGDRCFYLINQDK